MNRRRLNQLVSPSGSDPERGAALILALGVMVAISGVLAGLVLFVSTSTKASVTLEQTRNELYAADGAIEQAIRAVQANTNGLIGNACPAQVQASYPLNGRTIRVACAGQPSTSLQGTQVVIQRNVLFTACEADLVANACPAGSIIISAKVNFPTNAAGTVTGAFVQSWSVRP
jgi:type II secretory pathway pseudopilin PulG